MQSIYLARQEYLEAKDLWASVKPKEYPLLKDHDVFHQVAGQLFYTKKSINNSMKNIPEMCKITIQYEDFCQSPEMLYEILCKKYDINGYKLESEYKGIRKFDISNKKKIPQEEILKFKKAYNIFKIKDNDYND
jgi:hypothetical protein